MPYLVTAFFSMLASIGPSLIARILVGIGVYAISFTGLTLATTALVNMTKDNVNGLPAAAIQTLSLVKFDVAVNIVVAAVVLKFTLSGISGVVSKMGFKAPAP